MAGIPLHLWNLETFHSVVTPFGFLKRVDKETLDGDNLQFARLLVEVGGFLNVDSEGGAPHGGREEFLDYSGCGVGEASRSTKDSMDWTWAEVLSSYRSL